MSIDPERGKTVCEVMRRVVNDENEYGTVMFQSLQEIGFLKEEASSIAKVCRQAFLQFTNAKKKECKLPLTDISDFLANYVREQLQGNQM